MRHSTRSHSWRRRRRRLPALLLLLKIPLAQCLQQSQQRSLGVPTSESSSRNTSRRGALIQASNILAAPWSAGICVPPATAVAKGGGTASPNPSLSASLPFSVSTATAVLGSDSEVRLTVTQPTRLGLELRDEPDGASTRAVVRAIHFATRATASLEAGMSVVDFSSAAAVQERLQTGPYPVTLVFRKQPQIRASTPEDRNLDRSSSSSNNADATRNDTINNNNSEMYVIVGGTKNAVSCSARSRRGDVLEIEYEARLAAVMGGRTAFLATTTAAADDGPMYDSSLQRGTGQPYQMVLGSGDMLPGVDQGLYDMCPGDVRIIYIPPPLAYGARGNRLFQVPPNTPLVWKVTLISVNSIRE